LAISRLLASGVPHWAGQLAGTLGFRILLWGNTLRNSAWVRRIAPIVLAVLLALPLATSPAGGQQNDPRVHAVEIALEHLRSNASGFGVEEADLADLRVTDSYTSGHNRVTHVYLVQRIGGLEVFGANAAVNVAHDGDVLFVGNRLIELPEPSGSTSLGARAATDSAATELGLEPTGDLTVLDKRAGEERETELSKGGISLQSIPAKLVYQPVDGELRLAWNVEIEELSGKHWWNANVDAATGELLAKVDYVDDAHTTSAAAPAQATVETSADPGEKGKGTGDRSRSARYRVYPLPLESPLDGGRRLEVNVADKLASPFGWHDIDGQRGPEYTVTRGNNVHAYTDHNNDGIPDPGSDPDGGVKLDFDFPIDLTEHPHTYSDAAVTNLFYWNNIIHDAFYHYGFTEEAGNFQVNNYGRGGIGGDDVRGEAQDGGGLNNANFSTPPDGSRPRMQMYLWQHPRPNTVTIDPPSSAAGTYEASGATFGPPPSPEGLSGDVVLVNDGVGVTTDACEPLVGFPAGSIALLDRGSCTFAVKVKNAQNAGATAVIVANNVPGNPTTMSGADPTITIPSVMVTLDDGNTIKAGLPATGTVASDPDRGIMRDGDLDAGIIVHEYGHGISNRLTGGPSNTSCLRNEEQMGEGWSDWLATSLTALPSDDPESRGIGNYVLYNQDRNGPGIRPTPYSTNMSINPSTYDTIKTAAVPHGVGYVWATMLWEVYWDLVDEHGFNEDVYEPWGTGGNNLAIQLVMDGMKFQPCSPGFVDGRDAVLAADEALTGGANQCIIWTGFAKRGLGFSALQGTSLSRSDGVETFDTHPDCR